MHRPRHGRRPQRCWRPVRHPSLALLMTAREEELHDLAAQFRRPAEEVRDLRRQHLAELGVEKYRYARWDVLRRDGPCEKEHALGEHLQRLGLHPRRWEASWSSSGHCKKILVQLQVAWDVSYNNAGYMIKCDLWDAVGKRPCLPNMQYEVELRGLFYTDAALGASTDWVPYLFFESAASDYCCDCRSSRCSSCTSAFCLVPATLLAGVRISDHVLLLLTLRQHRIVLPLKLASYIGAFILILSIPET